MSGTTVLESMRTLEELIGPVALEAARNALPAQRGAELEGAMAMSWISMTTSGALMDAAAQIAGRNVDELIDQVARRTAERLFKTIWRMFFRFTSDEQVIKRTQALYARSRNVGVLSSRLTGEGEAELSLVGWPDVSDRQLRMLVISTTLVVELAGRTDVKIRSIRTPEGARFEVRWRG